MRLRLLACRCRGRCRCSLVSSSRRAVPSCVSCLLAARLAFAVSSHRLSSRLSSPLIDTVGLGVRRGDAGVMLSWFFPAVCVDVDSLSMPYHPAMSPRSACLSARLRGRWRSHLVRAGRVAMPCLPRRIVSSIASAVVSSVGSVLRLPRPVLRHDGRGGGRMLCGCRLSRLPVLACLGSFLAIHLMRMAAEVYGLSARWAGCLLCPVVSVPCRPSSHPSLFPMARSIDAARLRCPDAMVWV